MDKREGNQTVIEGKQDGEVEGREGEGKQVTGRSGVCMLGSGWGMGEGGQENQTWERESREAGKGYRCLRRKTSWVEEEEVEGVVESRLGGKER